MSPNRTFVEFERTFCRSFCFLLIAPFFRRCFLYVTIYNMDKCQICQNFYIFFSKKPFLFSGFSSNIPTMGYFLTDPASAVKKPRQKADPPSKKRVWKNFSTTRPRARVFASQPVEPHWEKQPTPTTTASGMLYYGYRFYAPSLGRWVSRDPAEEGGGVEFVCVYFK